MNYIHKYIVDELKEKESSLDFIGHYSASCYPVGLDDLYDDTPENSVHLYCIEITHMIVKECVENVQNMMMTETKNIHIQYVEMDMNATLYGMRK